MSIPQRFTYIRHIHKWQPRNYSFVFVLIILTHLTLKQKIKLILLNFVHANEASKDD